MALLQLRCDMRINSLILLVSAIPIPNAEPFLGDPLGLFGGWDGGWDGIGCC